jgi:hypothetical protein
MLSDVQDNEIEIKLISEDESEIVNSKVVIDTEIDIQSQFLKKHFLNLFRLTS